MCEHNKIQKNATNDRCVNTEKKKVTYNQIFVDLPRTNPAMALFQIEDVRFFFSLFRHTHAYIWTPHTHTYMHISELHHGAIANRRSEIFFALLNNLANISVWSNICVFACIFVMHHPASMFLSWMWDKIYKYINIYIHI